MLKKGSSGSLHTFENNEYSYKINLDSINTATGNTVSKNNSRHTGGNDQNNGSALGNINNQANGMMINENNNHNSEFINMWD